MQVAHHGGAYISRTVARGSSDEKTLLTINKRLVKALGLERGATHAEFIKSTEDGKFYFLEIAARVGGAYIADVLEAATGVNIWREWARMEIDSSSARKITATSLDLLVTLIPATAITINNRINRRAARLNRLRVEPRAVRLPRQMKKATGRTSNNTSAGLLVNSRGIAKRSADSAVERPPF